MEEIIYTKTPIPQEQPVPKGHVTLTVAALEVHSELKRSKLLCVIAIAGNFITALTGTLTPIAAAITGIIIASIVGFFLFQIHKKMVYLESKYNINTK